MLGQLEQLERQKTEVMLKISKWPERQLQFRPQPTAWSALEVLDHIVKVEQAFIEEVRANLPKDRAVTVVERVKAVMVNAVMRSPIRVKIPAGAEEVLPKPAVPLEAIGATWVETRRELDEMLRQVPPARVGVGVFHHPVSGWMPLGQALGFLTAHLRHHEYQLNRLERAAQNPYSSR